MNNSYPLITRIVSIVLMLIGIVFWLILAFDPENEGIVGSFVGFGKWMVIIGFILAILSFVVSIAVNPASLKKMLISLVVIGAVFAISYGLADGTVLPYYKDVDESTSKWVSTGLNSFYIVGLLAVLSVVYSGVARILK